MKELKLDFNERADSIPDWLQSQQLDLSQLWLYPDRGPVEATIAESYGLNNDQVLLTNGGDESIELLFKLCKLQNKRMVVPEPCFSQYTHGQNVWQLDAAFLPAGPSLCIDQKAIADEVKADDWLVLTRPNNPTGEYLDDAELRNLLDAAQQANAQVFLDEAYIEFAQPQSEWYDWSQEFPNVIILRSFSKAFGLAGARLGYLVGQAEVVNQFRKLAMPFNVSQLNLQIAAAGLNNRSEVRNYCEQIESNRNKVFQYLSDQGIEVCDSRANFLLFRLGTQQKNLLNTLCLANNIKIKSQLPGLDAYVRITIPYQVESLLSVLALALQPEVIAFDMDGVLIDTSQSYDLCIIQTVKHFTGQAITVDEVIQLRASGGFNNDWDLAWQLIHNQGQEVTMDAVIEIFQSLYHGNQNTPGLKQAETNLLNDQGRAFLFGEQPWLQAIVTGRPKGEAQDGLSQLKIKPPFVVSADDVSQQKPDPEGLLSVRNNSGKTRMWFCGDTVDDMQAGTAAGCLCIGIGPESEHLYAAGAHLVLENINQLKELL